MARKKKSTAEMPASPDMDRWRAKDDLRTLSSAAEIARDKARMRAAKGEAQRQMKALEHVAGKAPSDKASRRKRLEKVQL